MGHLDFNKSLVGFIDLLGFTERARNITSAQALDELINDVRFVQSMFDYSPDSQSTQESHQITKTKVLAFSDCIIICTPFKSDLIEIQGAFDTFFSKMVNLAYAQGNCVLNNVFVRGALDYGSWFYKNDILISPALIKAYELEKKAVVPVVRLSDSFYNFICEHPHRSWYSEDADPIAATFKKHEDGYYFIDYIRINIDSLGWQTDKARYNNYMNASNPDDKQRLMDDGYFLNCRNWLERHRKVILTASANATERSIKEKYDWLTKYHNDYVSSCKRQFADCMIT
jgi:hypothetical protein